MGARKTCNDWVSTSNDHNLLPEVALSRALVTHLRELITSELEDLTGGGPDVRRYGIAIDAA